LKLRQIIPVLLIAAGLWAYHNSFHGPFFFDDAPSIPENPHIRHLWPIPETLSAPPYSTVNGRPTVCLTLALNYAFGGLNVAGYHAANLTIHLLSALVLFGIVWRTLDSETLRGRFPGAAVGLAAVIALLWELHPLQTESVTYIVQRTESLMGLFFLLTLYGTIRGAHSPRPRPWYLAAVISCALGMGSKEVMVAAPLIVLLYDRVFLASSFRELWQRRAGLYVGLAATWLLLAVLVARTPHSATGFGMKNLTPWDYLKTEAGVILYYLRLGFWPRPLVIDYSDWPIAHSWTNALVPGAVVLGLLAATVWALRHRPALGFLGAWFFLILAPTSSVLPNVGEVAAERRMYLPLAAVVTIVVVGGYALGKRLFTKPQVIVLGCVATGAAAVWFTFLTFQRNQDYQSTLSIWQDTVDKRPSNTRAHNNLGIVLAQLGRVPEAIGQFQQALRIEPDSEMAHYNLGNVLVQAGRTEDAIGHYHEALRIDPGDFKALTRLGNVLQRLGRVPDAIGDYEHALSLKPDYAEAHNNLAVALMAQGRLTEAIDQYDQALQINPEFADAHCNLGFALEKAGRPQEAIAQYERALQFKPNLVEAQKALVRLQHAP
jgi:tetratricopeptide (TPR) repeat protein